MDIQEFRLGLAYRLIHDLEDVGKIQLQKLVYFLQEAFGIPTKYTFKMYHYGPYAEELDTDSSILKSIGYISIDPDSDGYGFHLKPKDGPNANWTPLIAAYSEQIGDVIKNFGKKPASTLELLATIHFANKLLEQPSQAQVIDTVRGLKPKFGIDVIKKHYDELAELHYL